MKQEAIFVTTNSEGMGAPENPYNKIFSAGEHMDYNEFNEAHPALPTYSQNNELIRNERVEVHAEPEWQFLYCNNWFKCSNNNPSIANSTEKQTRRIYRQVAIKEEKHPLDGDGLSDNTPHDDLLDAVISIRGKVSSAQPVKECNIEKVIKLSDGGGLLAHLDLNDESVSFTNYKVKHSISEFTFDDILHLASVINNIGTPKHAQFAQRDVVEVGNNFTQGYVCAVANLLRERDQPAMAAGLLESIGNISVYKLKKIGVDEQDIAVLRKYKLIR